jgi:dienelactone hydrolase
MPSTIRFYRSLFVTVLFVLAWPGPSVAAPEDPGSLAVKRATVNTPIDGTSLAIDLYWPDASVGAPWPAVVVGHGFARGKGRFVEWGNVLASHGYVVAIPQFPGSDHPRNGRIVSSLLAWMETASRTSGEQLFGLVDGSRRGVVGHSAGGLAALLAAGADPSIDVVVALDPVDNASGALNAAPNIKAPVTAIFATPGACNENGNAKAVLPKLTVPHMALSVIGGTHCDAEDPSDVFCGLFCGGAAASRQARFKRYAIATLDHVLLCETGFDSWLGGADMQADTLVTAISSSGFPPGCASTTPAGDAVTMDAVTMDAVTMDAVTMDAGTMDAGTMDAVTMDAVTMDGLDDASIAQDAGAADSSVDGFTTDGSSQLDASPTDTTRNDRSSAVDTIARRDSGNSGNDSQAWPASKGSDSSGCSTSVNASPSTIWPLFGALVMAMVVRLRRKKEKRRGQQRPKPCNHRRCCTRSQPCNVASGWLSRR